jgi:hypothetical protein
MAKKLNYSTNCTDCKKQSFCDKFSEPVSEKRSPGYEKEETGKTDSRLPKNYKRVDLYSL